MTITISEGDPDPVIAKLNVGDKVRWQNDDAEPHTIKAEGNEVTTVAGGATSAEFAFDVGQYDYTISGTLASGEGSIVVEEASTTTTAPTTTTTEPTTTSSNSSSSSSSSSTTTSTSSTTTTTSSTTTTTTRPVSSASGQVGINDSGKSGGGSSALPLLVGAFVLVAGLAGLAYWLWLRSGEEYYDEDEGPDWTQEPPLTRQGPSL